MYMRNGIKTNVKLKFKVKLKFDLQIKNKTISLYNIENGTLKPF